MKEKYTAVPLSNELGSEGTGHRGFWPLLPLFSFYPSLSLNLPREFSVVRDADTRAHTRRPVHHTTLTSHSAHIIQFITQFPYFTHSTFIVKFITQYRSQNISHTQITHSHTLLVSSQNISHNTSQTLHASHYTLYTRESHTIHHTQYLPHTLQISHNTLYSA